MSEIGQRLRAARIAAKLTQADVQARLGWGATAVSDYEKGKYGISDDRLIQLAGLYGADPSVIAGRPVGGARPDAFYDGILHALAAFNKASGELIAEVQAWRDSQREGGGASPPVSRAKLDAVGQAQLAADAEAARRRSGTG